MIRKVKIENYKSVQELELELGRVNVFIGENGCGKTSILEAIAMGSAASQDKLDNEFLSSRGIRILEPRLMKSAFNQKDLDRKITTYFTDYKGTSIEFAFNSKDTIGLKWELFGDSKKNVEDFKFKAESARNDLDAILNRIKAIGKQKKIKKDTEKIKKDTEEILNIKSNLLELVDEIKDYKSIILEFFPFLIFAPENYFLRRFEEEGQIRPLGIRGEGLFRHLTELAKEEPETIAAISQQLNLIDWFEKIEIPNDLQFSERRINITDRFIKDTITHFDQRSANEGFLYLLFYFTLFLSKYTPGFFAIDNIDNALNPKLCAKLTTVLAKLSAENDKQVILTTHNPAILDGMDLTDDEQRLFVIYRNIDGETTAHRVSPPKLVEGVEPVRLSEAFIRGYLGGLPKNF